MVAADPDDDKDWITLHTGDGWRMGLQQAIAHVPPRTRTIRSRPISTSGYRISTRRPDAPSGSAPPCCAATSGGTRWPLLRRRPREMRSAPEVHVTGQGMRGSGITPPPSGRPARTTARRTSR